MFEKLEKLSFDKIFFGRTNWLTKLAFIGLMFAIAFLVVKSLPFGRPIKTIFIAIIIIYVLEALLISKYKIIAGVNKQGFYSYSCGWIDWKYIKDVHIKDDKTFGHISIQLKSNTPFLRKIRYLLRSFSTKNITILFKKDADTSIEDVAKLIKEYIKKYSEK